MTDPLPTPSKRMSLFVRGPALFVQTHVGASAWRLRLHQQTPVVGPGGSRHWDDATSAGKRQNQV